MKKFFWFIAALVLALSCFGSSFAQAESVSKTDTDKGLKAIESVENYISYLKNESSTDSNAIAVLDDFNNLSKDQQEKYLFALQPENYIKIMDAVSSSNNEKTVNLDGVDIKAQLKVESTLSDITPYATYKNSHSTYSLYVLGVKTTTLSSYVTFAYSGTTATEVTDNYGSLSNFNPAVIFTELVGKGYLEGSWAIGRASWKAYASGSLGFINDTVHLFIKANGGSTKYYKVESTRSDWATGGWISF
ncbi:hypothetical protein [Bacillus sp. 1P06AnD]|uniref:hypothetical protein n=1 Tax=Bacillus sp. 1P06AnD TaxID=3132208 RepID=UPI0039A09003